MRYILVVQSCNGNIIYLKCSLKVKQWMGVGVAGIVGARVSVITVLELELETELDPVLILYHHVLAGNILSDYIN